MAKWNVGNKNGMWKGGKSIASNGYVLVKVGINHHLADVRGYAYEHRLIAERKINRKLKNGEIVHHLDGNKQNNNPNNLEIISSLATHRFYHRKTNSKLKLPNQTNCRISCACGCKKKFFAYDKIGRPRMFISGHNSSQRG